MINIFDDFTYYLNKLLGFTDHSTCYQQLLEDSGVILTAAEMLAQYKAGNVTVGDFTSLCKDKQCYDATSRLLDSLQGNKTTGDCDL